MLKSRGKNKSGEILSFPDFFKIICSNHPYGYNAHFIMIYGPHRSIPREILNIFPFLNVPQDLILRFFSASLRLCPTTLCVLCVSVQLQQFDFPSTGMTRFKKSRGKISRVDFRQSYLIFLDLKNAI